MHLASFLGGRVTDDSISQDIGGVVVGSPLAAINAYVPAVDRLANVLRFWLMHSLSSDRYEIDRGLPRHWINVAITQQGSEGAFQKFERNELDMYTFYKRFGQELSDASKNNEFYREFCELRGQPVPSNLPESIEIDGRELFGFMMRESFNPDPKMLRAISTLRASGRFKVAALTNNFVPPTVPSGEGSAVPTLEEEVQHLGLGPAFEQLKSFFDMYIESAKVGMRKPDPEFFKYALRALKVEAHETVFLDDIGINLKAARKLGIITIRVSPNSSIPALQELEKIVGMQLVDEEDLQEYEAKVAKRKPQSKL
ncbi:hypothetical protein OC835_004159 [Tilletia horrida]|nr:hypothetical protein OC835_004159 [Tilletia horrida]KAK0567082.1 hypothetical protein OC844_000420 [Tilletia horrida]